MSIDLLARQYSEHLDPALLAVPPARTLLIPAVQSALYDRMFDDARVWPQPPIPYQTRVLKMLLGRMEGAIRDPEEEEISSALLEKWTALILHPKPDPIRHAQQLTYIRYTAPTAAPGPDDGDGDAPRTIVTCESRGLILAGGTTGFRTWEAALHLGTYLATTEGGRALVEGRRVVELGAGTGFVSLLCAKHLGARRVMATDREAALVECMEDSARRNGVAARDDGGGVFEAGIWEWGTALGDDREEFDVALGADLIYDTDLVPLLVQTIRTLFTTHRIKQFVIAATLRNQDTFQAFLDACGNNQLKTERIDYTSPPPQEQTGFFHSHLIPIAMYRITHSQE
ncbi:putative methyltransferase-domain-containing protein [Aspergillus ambiguus]|uniref:protein-lysine N-methyltransferase n=1 Tax=Aspergillus ambiguus TaxID=176160 RepID=UPI003CCDBA22